MISHKNPISFKTIYLLTEIKETMKRVLPQK